MAIFDIQCGNCGKVEEVVLGMDEAVPDCECGQSRFKVWHRPPAGHAFKAGYYEHLDVDPVYVGSKAQLKDECNKRNLHSEYAWD